jgi:hypothetical protein
MAARFPLDGKYDVARWVTPAVPRTSALSESALPLASDVRVVFGHFAFVPTTVVSNRSNAALFDHVDADQLLHQFGAKACKFCLGDRS